MFYFGDSTFLFYFYLDTGELPDTIERTEEGVVLS